MVLYIKFYAQTIYKFKNNTMKISTNIIVYTNIREVVKFAVDNWRHANKNIIKNGDEKSGNDCGNVGLADLGLHTKILLKHSNRKKYCKWVVNDYIKSSKIKIMKIWLLKLQLENFITRNDTIFV